MTSASENTVLPSMLSYKRSINQGRALFYACSSAYGDGSEPLLVERKRVLGTKGFDVWKNQDKAKRQGDLAKTLEAYSTPNPATVDTCIIPESKPFLKAGFVVKYSAHSFKPHMCNDIDVYELLCSVVEDYGRLGGFEHLACAYVLPLVTGLFMWRNNDEASEKRIVITVVNSKTDKSFEFVPVVGASSLDELSAGDKAHAEELADLIADGLSGKLAASGGLALHVEAIYKMVAGGQAYPSQEMSALERTGVSKEVSRVLYRAQSNGVQDQAALSEQKIGNALRTIDTWHGRKHIGAIAVEPNGVVSRHQTSVRIDKKIDFYSLCRKNLRAWSDQLAGASSLDEIKDLDSLHFVIAVLIRGGVFA